MNNEQLNETLQSAMAERAVSLAKWLRILFFWSLLAMVGRGTLICERLLARIYKTYHLYLDFSIIGVTVLATIAMAWVFWKLGKESTSYYCVVFLLSISFCVEILLFEEGASGALWWELRSLEAGAVLVNTYQRYHGHAEILNGTDSVLADKWSRLWKWYIRLIFAIPAGLLAMLVFSDVGEVLVFAALLGLAVLGMMELACLWKTASVFRDYAPAEHEALLEAEPQ